MVAVEPNKYSPQVAELIPAFPKSGQAKYRLLDHGGVMDEVNQRDEVMPGRKVLGSPLTFLASASIYDPYQQDDVLLQVVTGSNVQGQGAARFRQEILQEVTFDKMGELNVPQVNQNLYRFLELHPKNRTNVLTGTASSKPVLPAGGWLFERVEPEKSARELAEQQRLIDRIRGIIGDNTDSENLEIAKRLPRSFKIDTTQDANSIYSQLRAAAERDPDTVFMATTDNAAKMDALITDALAGKLIVFEHEGRQYVDGRTNKPVLSVPTGEPREALRDWLMDAQGVSTRKAWQRELADKGGKQTEFKGIKVAPGQTVPEGYNPKPGKLGYHYPLTENE